MSKPPNQPPTAREWRPFLGSWRSLAKAMTKGTTVTMPDGRRVLQRGMLPPGASLIATPRTRGCCEDRSARPLCTSEGIAPFCRSRLDVTAPIDRAGKRHLDIVTPRTSLADFRDLGSRQVCALDVADQGEHSSAAIAAILNLTPRAVELVLARASGKVMLEANADKELAEDFDADRELTVRIDGKGMRGTRVPAPKPLDASVVLHVTVGSREIELTCTPATSRVLLAHLPHSSVAALRDLGRQIRAAFTPTDEAA